MKEPKLRGLKTAQPLESEAWRKETVRHLRSAKCEEFDYKDLLAVFLLNFHLSSLSSEPDGWVHIQSKAPENMA